MFHVGKSLQFVPGHLGNVVIVANAENKVDPSCGVGSDIGDHTAGNPAVGHDHALIVGGVEDGRKNRDLLYFARDTAGGDDGTGCDCPAMRIFQGSPS